jgi:hypothetical protein
VCIKPLRRYTSHALGRSSYLATSRPRGSGSQCHALSTYRAYLWRFFSGQQSIACVETEAESCFRSWDRMPRLVIRSLSCSPQAPHWRSRCRSASSGPKRLLKSLFHVVVCEFHATTMLQTFKKRPTPSHDALIVLIAKSRPKLHATVHENVR